MHTSHAKIKTKSRPCLERPFLSAGMQLEVVNADGCDDVAFTSGVARTVGEYDLVVALAAPQQTQILRERERGRGGTVSDSKCLLTDFISLDSSSSAAALVILCSLNIVCVE